jgi:hypothetical protein
MELMPNNDINSTLINEKTLKGIVIKNLYLKLKKRNSRNKIDGS